MVAVAGLVIQERDSADAAIARRVLTVRVREAVSGHLDVVGNATLASVLGRAPTPDLVERPGVRLREAPDRAVRANARRCRGGVDVARAVARARHPAGTARPGSATAR